MNLSNLVQRLRAGANRNDELAKSLLPLVESMHPNMTNLSPLVPLLFHYGGEPLSLNDHFTMEPLFNLYRPPQILMLCSRQVGKTVSMVMDAWMEALWTPHNNSLFVTPFYEATRRISTDYFASMQNESPLKGLFNGRGCVKQVLERTIPNGSRIRFTYACRTADRARGIHANSLRLDERQLMHEEVKTVLEATMNASEHGKYTMSAGTPLTNSNIASQEFKEASTRSHWMIPCRACRKENIAAYEYDLLGMIGGYHPNISRDRPAIKCANSKCGYPLFPWEGQYVHFNPEKREKFLGLHVPMVILPMHCCNAKKWQDFMDVMVDARVPEHKKFNEYLGVPYDDGVALLTLTDIEKVTVLGPNRLEKAVKKAVEYNGRIAVGVDWGGGGMTRESLTKVAVCGLSATGRIDVLFGLAITQRCSKEQEAAIIYTICKAMKPVIFAHDDANIGDIVESWLINMGLPSGIIWPMSYVGQTGGVIMKATTPSPERPKTIYMVDKARGLLHLVEAIKNGRVAFFDRTAGLGADGLLLDLTHLRFEEKVHINFAKSETVIVGREPGQSDDFAHAVHFAANALWTRYGAWPKLSQKLLFKTVQDLTSFMSSVERALDPEYLEALIGREAAQRAQEINEAMAT